MTHSTVGAEAPDTAQEDTMGVIGSDGSKYHLFRTRAEEDAAVARSPLKVAEDLMALADRVGAVISMAPDGAAVPTDGHQNGAA